MNTALQAVERARQEALTAQADIENKIGTTRDRIQKICRSGTLPFDEAFAHWLSDFERYANEGKQHLHVNFEGFASPNLPHPITGNTSQLRSHAGHPFENASRLDTGAVHAYIHRQEIIKEARQFFEDKCAQSNLPAQHEREAELERLADELRSLESERDDLQDELARLFRVEPSDRTKSARRRAEEQQYLDMINQNAGDERNASDPQAGSAEIFRAPK